MHDRQTAGADPGDPAPGQVARWQQGLAVAIAGAALALSGWLFATGRPGWALLALAAPTTFHAAALAAELLWMRRANRADPAGAPAWRALTGAWLCECAHALRVFAWWQPFRSRRWPDRPRAAAGASPRRGVLLVHGFVCNRGLWFRWMKALAVRDIPCVAVDLEPAFARIDDYAPILEAAVRRLEDGTGLPPVVVAHSMGALAVRHWWAAPGNAERLHHLITLGSPHHGTVLAGLALTPNGRQMRRESAWLRALAVREPAARRRRTTCYYSNCDNIVFPASSATLPGADNRLLQGVAHIRMTARPEPFDALLQRLKA